MTLTTKPLLLDLFCGAGGAAMGYYRAGFEIIGVDLKFQKNYPFTFVQGDALDIMRRLLAGETVQGVRLDEIAAIHASPPCQRYSYATPIDHKDSHPDLIAVTRQALIASGKPYVIENVPGAVRLMRDPILLCGSMFNLNLWRHRYFENSFGLQFSPMGCNHDKDNRPVLITGTTRRKVEGRKEYGVEACRVASGIDWMIRTELDEAIPPAYTEYIGKQLLAAL